MRVATWLKTTGEMSDRIRAFDWSKTSMGSMDSWPQSLRTAVDLMMRSRQPTYLAWGPELISIHNEAFISILGAKHPHALGTPYSELWAEVWTDFEPIVAATLAGEAQYFVDQPVAINGRPGIPIGWFTFAYTPLPDERGQIAGFYCTATETTAKVRAEERSRALTESALHKSEQRYRSLFESMDEGFCILHLIFDQRGKPIDYRFLETNPSFEKQSGMKDVLGRTVRELVPDIESFWIDNYGEVALTGQSKRLRNRAAALNRFFDAYAFRIDEAQDHHVAVLFNDVTSTHEADARWRRTLQIKTVGVMLWGEQFALTYVNDAFLEMTGFTREEAMGKTWQELTPIEFHPASLNAVHEVITKGETTPYEKQYFRKDGSRWWGLFAARNIGKEVVEFVLDVTKRRDAEDALRAADRRKDEFLATLAHELRNPLAALGAAAELLNRPAQKPQVVALARDALHRQVAHMARLLDDLLDVARITHGFVQLRLDAVDVCELVRAAAETVKSQLETKQHRLTLQVPTEPIYVNADAVRLSQVVGNLLNNAAKYTPANGDIELSVRHESHRARISVKDNGIGIDPVMLERMFEMFSQGKQLDQHPSSGLGIGLALVKKLVEMHKGTIEAMSAGEGQGSEFTIRLPLASPAERHIEAAPIFKASDLGPLRILIADDNIDSARSWALLLQQRGHEVRTAFEGESAWLEAMRFHPDVALLDIGMPQMSGYEVAEKIRATDWGSHVTLVAVTGWGQMRDREEAARAGFDYHFTKPASTDDIDNVLRSVRPQLKH
ncbi:MAG TPA: ATP-binding protein [Steroidobacteraceae bacterium]|nr:ATP-binding protein [Steroidobacteraceae bacterium]